MVHLNLGFVREGLKISPKRFAATILMTSGTLAWFFLLNLYLGQILTYITSNPSSVQLSAAFFYGTSIFSAIIGGFIGYKVKRQNFLLPWVLIGIISTISLAFFQGEIFSETSSIFLGLSLGLGLPSCLAFLADCTEIEERGRVSGIAILTSFVIAFLVMGIIRNFGSGLVTIVVSCAVVRAVSIPAFLLDKCENTKDETEYRSIKPDYRELSFYLLPWIMFVITSSIASSLIPDTELYRSSYAIGSAIRYVFIALFGFLWGFVADRVGRKWPIIIGLVILSISFALLGFSLSPDSALFYLAISGVAWGAFFTIYLVIPGDLSIPSSRGKFYALGTISPLFILFSLSMLASSAIPSSSASSTALILSVILSLSLVPALRAKETIEESKIRERRMREYAKKVGKIARDSKWD